MNRSVLAVAAVVAIGSLALTACKSSGNGSSSSTGAPASVSQAAASVDAGGSGLDRAKALVSAAATEPTQIPISTPRPSS